MTYLATLAGATRMLSLEELIPHAEQWRIGKNSAGEIIAVAPFADSLPLVEEAIPLNAFYALDPRFEAVFNELASFDLTFSGESVATAFAGWDTALLALPIAFIPPVCRLQAQPETFKVLRIHPDTIKADISADLISFDAAHFVPRLLKNGGGEFAIVDMASTVTLPLSWVTEHCPDWQQKKELAIALDLDPAVVPQFVFGDPRFAATALPGTVALLGNDLFTTD